MNVRVRTPSSQVLNNVVHRRSEFHSSATKCHVKGGWHLEETTDAVTCASCIRRMGSG